MMLWWWITQLKEVYLHIKPVRNLILVSPPGSRPGITASLPVLSVLLEESYLDLEVQTHEMSKVVAKGVKGKGRKKKEVMQLDYDVYDGKKNKELQEALERRKLLSAN
jgi:hypothetical protein